MDSSKNCVEIDDSHCVRKNPNGSCILCDDDRLPVHGKCDDSSEECDVDDCEYC